MTVQELSRYLTLRKQIDEDKEIYENMCQKMGPASPSLSGMPHTPGVRDKVGDLAADLADLDTHEGRMQLIGIIIGQYLLKACLALLDTPFFYFFTRNADRR